MKRSGRDSGSFDSKNDSARIKNKGVLIFFRIMATLFIAINVAFYAYITSLNMIPAKYLIPVIICITLIVALLSWMLISKKRGIAGKIICLMLMLLIAYGYQFAYKNLSKTEEFLDTMSSSTQNEEVEEYYVIARSDSAYSTIEDTKGKKVYTYNIAEDVQNLVLEKSKVTFEKSESLEMIYKNLQNKKIELALLSSSQYNIMCDEDETFKSNIKIVSTLTKKLGTKPAEEVKDETSDHTVKSGIFNIYISGIDTTGSIRNVSRSDANMLLTVNTKTHQILLTSIPRDYYVTLHTYKAKDKLTHSGIYGIKETVSTVEDFMGIDINYYVRVNFTTVIKMVDVIGGIDVDSDYAFTTGEGYSFKKGTNHLNGQKALAFSRERYSFADGDRQRVRDQQKVINAIITKLTSSTTLLSKYTDILKSLSGSFQTNLTSEEINYLIKGQLDNMTSWSMTSFSLDGTSASASTYSMGSQKLYVMIPTQKTIDDAKEKINEVLNAK